ncbi:hypothetical protein MKX03_009463, partial [Papaver bracteatum]
AVMEKPEDFPEELVDILFEDAYHTSYGRTGIEVSKASNAGTEVVLPTREEVTTSAKGVKSMAEKGQGGDEVVNSSAGDKKGGKANSDGDSLEEMKDGKAVEDSATVEASEDSSLSAGTEIWIHVIKGKKKYPAGKGDTNEKVEILKVKNPFMVFGNFKMEDLLGLGLKFNLTENKEAYCGLT